MLGWALGQDETQQIIETINRKEVKIYCLASVSLPNRHQFTSKTEFSLTWDGITMQNQPHLQIECTTLKLSKHYTLVRNTVSVALWRTYSQRHSPRKYIISISVICTTNRMAQLNHSRLKRWLHSFRTGKNFNLLKVQERTKVTQKLKINQSFTLQIVQSFNCRNFSIYPCFLIEKFQS